MNLKHAQRQIDSIRNALQKAKNSGMLPPNDPALVELERIMLKKVGELEAAKIEAEGTPGFENLLFGDVGEDREQQDASKFELKLVR